MNTAARLKKEGEALGEARGEARGRIHVISLLLRKRFGQLPAEFTTRLESATVAALDRCTDTLLDATTLEDVLSQL
ncbi:MAG: DUF4351 domain-containing protein [Planctomycetota bacterium]